MSEASAPSGKREYRFKIIVVGALGTGKTSIIKRFVNNYFSKNYKATVGVDFALKVIDVDAKTRVYLQLWDIAGQERFGSVTKIYYKDAVGAIIVFDLTRQQTFEAVDKWKLDIEDKLNSDDPIPMLLIGNKNDLVKDKKGCVEPAQLDEYVKANNFIAWYQTSAKENENVNEAINFLVKKVIENVASDADQSRDDTITLVANSNENTKPEKQCCWNS